MSSRTLAVDIGGNMSWCTVSPEERGKGRCHHIGHHEEGESLQEFAKRSEDLSKEHHEGFPKLNIISNPYADLYKDLNPHEAVSRLNAEYISSEISTDDPNDLDIFEDIKKENFQGQLISINEHPFSREFNEDDFEYAKDTHNALKFLATTNVYSRAPFPGNPELGEVEAADIFNQELKDMGVNDPQAREKLIVAMSWYEMNGATDNWEDDKYWISESKLSDPDGSIDKWTDLAENHFSSKENFCNSIDHIPGVSPAIKDSVKKWAVLHSKEMSIMPRTLDAASTESKRNKDGSERGWLGFNRLVIDLNNEESESGKLLIASSFVNKHPEFYSQDVDISRILNSRNEVSNQENIYNAQQASNRMK